MSELNNAPAVKLALVGVSRDCFPADLTRRRLAALEEACRQRHLDVVALSTLIENGQDTLNALAEADAAGATAAVVFLGNFGPEGPLSIFAERFAGPVMACAAAEEGADKLVDDRGDALCGLLNASYNFNLRSVNVHIPERPVGGADALAETIEQFVPVARVALGVAGLKIFSFGPRPQDFYACNAPIGPLYDLGVEVMENSELDMLQCFQAVEEGDPQVTQTVESMNEELGDAVTWPDLLPKLARFEVALRRFAADNLGTRQYAVFANKCWPAFEKAFGFVPCYINSRLSTDGMPVACEVDLYGALSEYICYLASGKPATLLDINNSAPGDLVAGEDLNGAAVEDLFMGFHCGNTPSCCMKNCAIKYQLIMKRLMEGEDAEPDITRGTLEGQLAPGAISMYRLQGGADGLLRSYIADGHILDVDPRSFGCIGVVAVPNFARFYRHVLIAQSFPHHSAIAFEAVGRTLYDATAYLGLGEIATPLPASLPYAGENPFSGGFA